jgi:sulfopyruvate decarboxylase TPP-binding subunit
MASQNMKNMQGEFVCEICDYKCSRKFCLQQHQTTAKHINAIKSYENATSKYACKNCDKYFQHHSSLYRHQKICNSFQTINQDVIIELLKQNQDFKMLIVEQNNKLEQHNTKLLNLLENNVAVSNTINNINSNNKTFNLQLFLLENCKDAMNLSEFLESIKIQLADVEAVGELGYINGISKLIIQNLKSLDVTKRPIHCTDEKREIIYIKEAGVWTKDEDCSKLRRLIKTVSNRNFKHTRLYKEKYPDCITSESKYSDTYNKIVIEATGGGSKCNDYESENKIMKKIAKAITIDKSDFLTKA